MFSEHYPALVVAYLVGLGGWLLANRMLPRVWPSEPDRVLFGQPWREFGIALLAALGILVMGQLWMKGIHLPEKGALGPILGAINQSLVFAPILLLMILRRQPWTTAWVPRTQIAVRLLVGLVLASLAVTAYALLRDSVDKPWVLLGRIWRYENLDFMVQVFLEDLTIAILFIRLAGAMGSRWATVTVACLFAAGHIPAMASQGATWFDVLGYCGTLGSALR